MHLTQRLPRETGRDYALRVIKDNIIRLDLAPGSFISENELSAQLGLSRTPVREALIELSKVKIVEITPQKRSLVAPIDYDLVEEARFMRNTLECAVAELVCAMATPEDIRMLEENVHLQQFYMANSYTESLMTLDNQFHHTLFQIAQKTQVYEMMENLAIHFDRVRSMALSSVKDLKIVQDHEKILEAIKAGNGSAARAVMQKHLSRYKFDAAEIRAKYPQYFTDAPSQE